MIMRNEDRKPQKETSEKAKTPANNLAKQTGAREERQ